MACFTSVTVKPASQAAFRRDRPGAAQEAACQVAAEQAAAAAGAAAKKRKPKGAAAPEGSKALAAKLAGA